MDPIIKEIKRRLKKGNCGHLRVRRGRSAGYCWIEIRRPNPREMLSVEKEEVIAKVFREKREGGGGNVYLILSVVAEMKLGMRWKKPVCEICGRTFENEKRVRDCELSH